MAAMAEPPAVAEEELGSIDEEVAALSREELIQFAMTGMAVGVNRTSAEVPAGWEAVVAEYLDATLQAKEAADLVQIFTHADKARIEGIVHKVIVLAVACPPATSPARPAARPPPGADHAHTTASSFKATRPPRPPSPRSKQRSSGRTRTLRMTGRTRSAAWPS